MNVRTLHWGLKRGWRQVRRILPPGTNQIDKGKKMMKKAFVAFLGIMMMSSVAVAAGSADIDQYGGFNSAVANQTNSDGSIDIDQGAPGAPAFSNQAVVTQENSNADTEATVSQTGDENIAVEVYQSGDNLDILVDQQGDANVASSYQTGNNNSSA